MTPSVTLVCAEHDCFNCDYCENDVSGQDICTKTYVKDPEAKASTEVGFFAGDIDNETKRAAEALVLLSSSYKVKEESGIKIAAEALVLLSSSYKTVGEGKLENSANALFTLSSDSEKIDSSIHQIADTSYKKDIKNCSVPTHGSSVVSRGDSELDLDVSVLPEEEIYSSFFSIDLLFRLLVKSCVNQLVFSLVKKGVMSSSNLYMTGIIDNTVNNIFDMYLCKISAMSTVDNFLKCYYVNGTNLDYVRGGFLSESGVDLLKLEFRDVFSNCSEDVARTIIYFDNKHLLSGRLRDDISFSITDLFNKCVSKFIELVTSASFLKSIFFRSVSWSNKKIFSPLVQTIHDFNRKLFCDICFLERKYLVNIIFDVRLKHKNFLYVMAKFPKIFELVNLHLKKLECLVTDLFKKAVPALKSDGNVVTFNSSGLPKLTKGVIHSLKEDVLFRMSSRKKIFRRRYKVDNFSESDRSSLAISSNDFYESLNSVISDGKNYIGNGFRYYLMKIFTPVCVFVAYDIREIIVNLGNILSSQSCFRLETTLRCGMFNLILSVLSDMEFLNDVDTKFGEVSLHVGMNIHDVCAEMFANNLIDNVKNGVSSLFTFELFVDIFPKKISVLSEDNSKIKRITNDMIHDIFKTYVDVFREKVQSVLIYPEFLNFYIENTLFTKFDGFDFCVSNADISKINSVKLELLYKIIREIDRSNYINIMHARRSDFFVSGKKTNSLLNDNKLEIVKFMPWLRDEIKAMITKSTLVLDSGVVSELGEPLVDQLLEIISNSVMNECVSTVRDVICVDKSRISADKSNLKSK